MDTPEKYKSPNSIRRQIIAVCGNGFSGNSAITDWLFDNRNDKYDVIRHDFDEIRENGGWIDILSDGRRGNISALKLKHALQHSTRVAAINILHKFKMSNKKYDLERRDNFIKQLELYLYGFACTFSKNPLYKRYLYENYISRLGNKDKIVLNNPTYLTEKCIRDFINIEPNSLFIFTHRNYEDQFCSWTKLNYKANKYIYGDVFDINNMTIEEFYKLQKHNLSTIATLQKHNNNVINVSYEKFISSCDYRMKLFKKIGLGNLECEHSNKFDANKSTNELNKNIINRCGFDAEYSMRFSELDEWRNVNENINGIDNVQSF